MKTKLMFMFVVLALVMAACATPSTAEPTTMPTAMPEPTATPEPTAAPTEEPASQTIVEIAAADDRFTTLVAAVQAAGLAETLSGEGPFTVFAPVNDAFAALPAGTVDTLLKPENKQTLTQVLTYHVVPGKVDAASLVQQIKAGGGKAMLKTASGGTLTASMRGNDVVIMDVKGNAAVVTTADVYQSNGVIHVVDKVLLPS